MTPIELMQLALTEAKKAAINGEIPIGAVVVQDGHVIALAHNLCEETRDPTGHAEMLAIRAATKKLNDWRLTDCTLCVTTEPCPMCLGALFQARVDQLYFGCPDPKRAFGGKLSAFPTLQNVSELTDNNHTLKITGGILKTECADLLKIFFKSRRGRPRP